MKGWTWTEEEKNILREYYPLYGTEKCKDFLPNRTIEAINNKANYMGIKLLPEVRHEMSRKYALIQNADSKGENNPNWKGGVSKDAYHYKLKSIAKYPEKNIARVILSRAIRSGVIKRLPCEVCGESKSEAHHEDYSKPLEVKWLCRKHHNEADMILKSKGI